MPIRSGRVLTSHFRSSWDHVFDNVEERWGRIRIVQFVAREALGILAIGQPTKPPHSGCAAVSVFPNQVFSIEIAPNHHGPPAQYAKVQHILLPCHAGGGAWAVLILPQGKIHTALGVVAVQATGSVWPHIVNDATGCNHHCSPHCSIRLDVAHFAANASCQRPRISAAASGRDSVHSLKIGIGKRI